MLDLGVVGSLDLNRDLVTGSQHPAASSGKWVLLVLVAAVRQRTGCPGSEFSSSAQWFQAPALVPVTGTPATVSQHPRFRPLPVLTLSRPHPVTRSRRPKSSVRAAVKIQLKVYKPFRRFSFRSPWSPSNTTPFVPL